VKTQGQAQEQSLTPLGLAAITGVIATLLGALWGVGHIVVWISGPRTLDANMDVALVILGVSSLGGLVVMLVLMVIDFIQTMRATRGNNEGQCRNNSND
jgi:uncharacterized membrane protein